MTYIHEIMSFCLPLCPEEEVEEVKGTDFATPALHCLLHGMPCLHDRVQKHGVSACSLYLEVLKLYIVFYKGNGLQRTSAETPLDKTSVLLLIAPALCFVLALCLHILLEP